MLFALDMVTNVTDYGFHVYLGWVLTPGDFASIQTINALLLIVTTAFAVTQPVIARYIAETADRARANALFQTYFWQTMALGVGATLLLWLVRRPFANWLNIPPATLTIFSLVLLFTLVRPVVAGYLQGQKSFFAFGLIRISYALSRLLGGIVLISLLGMGLLGGVASLPLAAALALGVSLYFAGRNPWQQKTSLASSEMWAGWRLSLAVLFAYGLYMTLLNLDLLWVNRSFSPDLAGSYASAVVLRRVLVLLPGAVVVVLYPRFVEQMQQRKRLDKTLGQAAVLIVGSSVALTTLFFGFGDLIMQFVFGVRYVAAGSLLGWMGVGMIGFGLNMLWLNLFLAAKPWPFVLLLGLVTVLQGVVLGLGGVRTLLGTTAVFTLTSWLLAIGGLALYLFWLRPSLAVEKTA